MGTLRLRSLGGCSAQGDIEFVILSERSESNESPEVRSDTEDNEAVPTLGGPFDQSSASFAQGDMPGWFRFR